MLLNVISHNTAYCLYPRATLHERRTLILHDGYGMDLVTFQDAITMSILGFEDLDDLTPDEFTNPRHASSFPLGWRSPHDPHTWRLPLPTTGVDSLIYDDPLSICSFLLQYNIAAMASIARHVMSSASLKYDYLVADKELLHHLQGEMMCIAPVWDCQQLGLYSSVLNSRH